MKKTPTAIIFSMQKWSYGHSLQKAVTPIYNDFLTNTYRKHGIREFLADCLYKEKQLMMEEKVMRISAFRL